LGLPCYRLKRPSRGNRGRVKNRPYGRLAGRRVLHQLNVLICLRERRLTPRADQKMLFQDGGPGVAKTAKGVFLQNVLVRVVEGNKAVFHRDLQVLRLWGNGVRRSEFKFFFLVQTARRSSQKNCM
jgi:hypothetical protein